MSTSEAQRVGISTPFRHLPNAITVLRLLLVGPAGWLLWHGAAAEALILIAVAGLSDAADGLLARRYNWRSRFGAFADPAADKLLSVVVFVVLAAQGHLPWWLLCVVVGRDLVILSGAFAYRRLLGELEMDPTPLSKANTGLQVALVFLVVVGLTDAGWLAAAATAIVDPVGFVVVAATGVASGIHYVIVWTRRAVDGVRARESAG